MVSTASFRELPGGETAMLGVERAEDKAFATPRQNGRGGENSGCPPTQGLREQAEGNAQNHLGENLLVRQGLVSPGKAVPIYHAVGPRILLR